MPKNAFFAYSILLSRQKKCIFVFKYAQCCWCREDFVGARCVSEGREALWQHADFQKAESEAAMAPNDA